MGNIQLDNFLMVGAGWTKTGQAVQTLWTIGAAAVVVGGVVLNKQRGNEGKTQDMFTSGVSWNYIGLKSPGAKVIAEKLSTYQSNKIPILANIAPNTQTLLKNIPQNLRLTASLLKHYVSGFEFDCSCPNLNKDNLFTENDYRLLVMLVARGGLALQGLPLYKTSLH